MTLLRLFALAGVLLLSALPALAHKGSDAYLDVQELRNAASPAVAQRQYRFALAVAIKDLDLLLPVDANADGQVTWGEVRAVMPMVLALLDETANIEQQLTQAEKPGAPACRLHWQSDGVDRRSDGNYIRVAATVDCLATKPLRFRYSLLKDQDSNHRLLVAGRVGGKDLLTTTSPQQPSLVLSAGTAGTDSVAGLGSGAAVAAVGAMSPTGPSAQGAQPPSGAWSALGDYFALGVHHLLEGYDHLAFLLALVLPLRLVLSRRAAPGVWLALLRTVTAFTIGHSITLVLATFGLTEASPRWVEPAIALSIAVTALLNLRPLAWVRTDVLALLFGLVHGYGFAGLLLEAAAPSGLLPWALAGFNLGVEAGQLIAVAGWVLLSQPLAAQPWYPRVVVRGGSMLLVLLAAFWFWQRVG